MKLHPPALLLCLGLAVASAVAQTGVDDEEQPADAIPQRASPDELRWVADHVTFYRGRFERPITGYSLMIPPAFHLLDFPDARRVDAAFGHPLDRHLVGAAVDRAIPLTDPHVWLVRIRWMSDGLVVAKPGELDVKGLVEAARSQPHVTRLASSGGTLQRFLTPPVRDGAEVDWVEERLPAGAKMALLDCHALRLARKGVLEFSIVGVGANLQQTCLAGVRDFARSVSFDPVLEYPSVAGSNALAPYSLSGLIAQTQ